MSFPIENGAIGHIGLWSVYQRVFPRLSGSEGLTISRWGHGPSATGCSMCRECRGGKKRWIGENLWKTTWCPSSESRSVGAKNYDFTRTYGRYIELVFMGLWTNKHYWGGTIESKSHKSSRDLFHDRKLQSCGSFRSRCDENQPPTRLSQAATVNGTISGFTLWKWLT